MYLVKTPRLIQALLPSFTWHVDTPDRRLFLTFDDGPIPEITPWVLETLQQYNAHATFFCVGENVQRHPAIFQQILAAGHAVGNHTYNHLSGYSTDNISYFNNIRRCARLVPGNLFRPPYGRIRPGQRAFLEKYFRVVMWDVLSGDFDPNTTAEQCLDNVLQNARAGSIVVLHDSLKSEQKLRYILPRILAHFTKEGYSFDAIEGGADKRLSVDLSLREG